MKLTMLAAQTAVDCDATTWQDVAFLAVLVSFAAFVAWLVVKYFG